MEQWCQASEQWWSNGARHRSNGGAMVPGIGAMVEQWCQASEQWWSNDARHRSNGGAMVPGIGAMVEQWCQASEQKKLTMMSDMVTKRLVSG